jgi:biotin carboxylase
MKTLMIIGAGAEQVPAYELAKKRGFKIVGTDINIDAPGLKLADYILNVSTKDAELTAKKALHFNEKNKIDGVMTIANDVPYTVALVACKLNLPSISLKAAACASNKLEMKKAFQEHNVSCPWFIEVNTLESLKKIVLKTPGKMFVLKPVDGSGARGVLLIDHKTDLSWAFNESTKWGQSGNLMIEEFIEGTQISSESFILDGECFTPGISERNYSKLDDFKPYIIEDGGTIPADIDIDLEKKISKLVLDGAHAMGINRGIIKGDIVIDRSGNPLIIELAARLSGGWFSTHQIPATSGVNLVNAVMSECMGIPINKSELQSSLNRSTAVRYFFPEEGEIISIKGTADVAKSKGVLKYGIFRKEGEIQPKVLMHPDRFGYVLVEAASRDESIDLVSKAMKKLKIKIRKL